MNGVRTNWNQRYAVADYIYGTEPNIFFKKHIDALKPGKLLLPAEGEGRNAVYAAKKGWNIEAFDFSTYAREKAMSLATHNQISLEYEISSIEDYNFSENAYDAIGLIYVHLDPEVRIAFHHKIIKSLKHGGLLIFEAFSKQQLKHNSGGPKNEEWLFSLNELACDFATLHIIEKEEKKLNLAEGTGHQGEAEIIRFIAQKI